MMSTEDVQIRERLARLEEQVVNLRMEIQELKEEMQRLNKYIGQVHALQSKVGMIAFVMGLIMSGFISAFFYLFNRKVGG